MNVKKQNIKKINIFAIIVNLILMIVISLISYLLIKNNILSLKMLIIYFSIVIFIPLIILGFLFLKKTPSKVKIALIIIDCIYIIILSLISFYLFKTFDFIDKYSNESKYIAKNYSVLVPITSDYKDIQELDNKEIGYIKITTVNYQQALEELQKKITIQSKDYLDYITLFKALKLHEIEAFIISDTYYQILQEELENLDNDFRIIYSFSIKEEIDIQEIDTKEEINATQDTFNIYITGLDIEGNISNISRSDVNIVISVNSKTNQILMIHIPRDYYVTFHGLGRRDKLTHTGLYGTEMSVKTVEDLLDINIDYYLKVNFNSVINIVNALGGVDVYSEYSFQGDGFYFQKGFNHVNGKQALTFVRIRKVLPGGDRARGKNQQALISAIIKKITTPSILMRYTSLLDSLKGSFYTNMPTDKITDIVKTQLDNNPKWNIISISLNGSDSEDYTIFFPNKKVYVMKPNLETIEIAKENLKAVEDGKILENSY